MMNEQEIETANVDDLQLLESEEITASHGPDALGCLPCPSLGQSTYTHL